MVAAVSHLEEGDRAIKLKFKMIHKVLWNAFSPYEPSITQSSVMFSGPGLKEKN